jgi:hypothetical protein
MSAPEVGTGFCTAVCCQQSADRQEWWPAMALTAVLLGMVAIVAVLYGIEFYLRSRVKVRRLRRSVCTRAFLVAVPSSLAAADSGVASSGAFEKMIGSSRKTAAADSARIADCGPDTGLWQATDPVRNRHVPKGTLAPDRVVLARRTVAVPGVDNVQTAVGCDFCYPMCSRGRLPCCSMVVLVRL